MSAPNGDYVKASQMRAGFVSSVPDLNLSPPITTREEEGPSSPPPQHAHIIDLDVSDNVDDDGINVKDSPPRAFIKVYLLSSSI